MSEPRKHPFTWPTEHRPAVSLACHQQDHAGCTGYGDPLDRYWCGCRCHDPKPAPDDVLIGPKPRPACNCFMRGGKHSFKCYLARNGRPGYTPPEPSAS